MKGRLSSRTLREKAWGLAGMRSSNACDSSWWERGVCSVVREGYVRRGICKVEKMVISVEAVRLGLGKCRTHILNGIHI